MCVLLAGAAGDVILWHASLAHCASSNARLGEPRIGCFVSFSHAGIRGQSGVTLEELESDAPPLDHLAERRCGVPTLDDMWEAWSAEMRNAGRGGAARL